MQWPVLIRKQSLIFWKRFFYLLGVAKVRNLSTTMAAYFHSSSYSDVRFSFLILSAMNFNSSKIFFNSGSLGALKYDVSRGYNTDEIKFSKIIYMNKTVTWTKCGKFCEDLVRIFSVFMFACKMPWSAFSNIWGATFILPLLFNPWKLSFSSSPPGG